MLTNHVEVKIDVARYWDKRSESYDNSPSHTGMPEVWKQILSSIFKKESRILDIGTGTGFLAVLLAELGHEVVGIDISSGMLKIAKSKSKNSKISFNLGDAENLPFADNSFDATICRHVFWTLPNPDKALSECYRVIKNGGKAVIIDGTWNSSATLKIKSFIGKLGIAVTERRNPWKRYPLKSPLRELSVSSYVNMIRDAGFKKVYMHDLSWLRKIIVEKSFFHRLAWSSKSYFILEAFKEV